MNREQRLLQKRRKRQAKRKDAQATARRRGVAEKETRERMIEQLRKPKAAAPQPGLLGRFFGGTPVAPDQMDSEAAPIVGGGQ